MKKIVFAFDIYDGSPVGRYESISDAARSLGTDTSSIGKVLSGRISHTRGYVFSYDGTCPRLPWTENGSNGQKPKRYWTIEKCLDEAKRYRSRSEFKKNSNTAWDILRKAGLLDRCVFEEKMKPRGFYTKEKCLELAMGFSTKTEFKNSFPTAYSRALKNGWLKECLWFKNINHEKWTREDVFKHVEEKKYSTWAEFCDNSKGAYKAALRFGISADDLGLKKSDIDYSSRHESNYWSFERCKEIASGFSSRSDMGREYSGAYQASLKNGWLDLFFPETKKKHLWSRDEVLDEMKKYDTISEFHNNASGAYAKARQMGWLNEKEWKDGRVLFGERITKWTREKCAEIAKLCVSRGDFAKKFPQAYKKAWIKRWLDDYTWFLQTKNLLEDGGTVYSYEFEDNSVYVGITIRNPEIRDSEHRAGCTFSGVYEHSMKTGIPIPKMKILASGLCELEMKRLEGEYVENYKKLGYSVLNKSKTGIYSSSVGSLHRIKWTEAACLELAKKCRTKTEMKKQSSAAFRASKKNGWISDYTWFVNGTKLAYEEGRKVNRGKIRKWTRERCLEIAKMCSGKAEMNKKSQSAYDRARKNGWIRDYTWFKSTHELKSKSITRARSRPEVKAKFMGGNNPMSRKVVQYSLDGNLVAEYSSLAEATARTGSDNISGCCSGRRKTAGGFIWKYADET